jgi:hypothetical protein
MLLCKEILLGCLLKWECTYVPKMILNTMWKNNHR